MKRKINIGTLLLMLTFTCLGQENTHKVKFMIPDVSLMDIETDQSSKDIILQVLSPNEAGLPASTTFEGANYIWLNYTSIKRGGGAGNQKLISVRISNGTLPEGVSLKAVAYNASNHGLGKKGVPVSGYLVLSNSDQTIIHEIESAFTGNGSGKGHKIEYSLLVEEEETEDLDNALDETELTITYTLTED